MKLIPPILPGSVFIVGAAAEVGLLLAQNGAQAHEVAPFWVQLIPVGVVFGIGAWGLIRLFAHERETAKRFAEMEERLEVRDDTRHRENQQAIGKLAEGQADMRYLLMGIQGKGGLLEERQKNQERRHELAQEITILYGMLREQAVFLTKVGQSLKVPFDPTPIERPGRRRGEPNG